MGCCGNKSQRSKSNSNAVAKAATTTHEKKIQQQVQAQGVYNPQPSQSSLSKYFNLRNQVR